MKTFLVLVFLLVCSLAGPLVTEFDLDSYRSTLKKSRWLANVIYSPACKVCGGLMPEYNKVAKAFPEVVFGRLNGELYYNQTTRYKVTTYPTIFMFHAGVDLPIVYRGQWLQKPISDFVSSKLNAQLTAPEKDDFMPVVLTGKKDSREYDIIKLLSLRDPFKDYRFVQNNDKTQLKFEKQILNQFDESVEELIRAKSARLLPFSEEAFYRTEIMKQDGLVFINKDYNDRVLKQLHEIAVKHPEIVVFHIEPHHQQYKDLLSHYEVWDEASIIGLRPSQLVIHRLAPPLKTESVNQFVQDFIDQKLAPHLKTEISKDPHVLTTTNANLVKDLKKDVLLVLYDSTHKDNENLMKFMHVLIRWMKPNENIHIFKCNVKKNEINIGIPIEPVPKIAFFRHRMKDDPVYYDKSTITWKDVIEFIMENTTFDWPEELEDNKQEEEL